MTKRCLLLISLGFVLIAGALLIVSILTSQPLYDERIDEESGYEARIADVEEALTLARFRNGDAIHILLVDDMVGGEVSGIDLSAYSGTQTEDPIELFAQLGYDALAKAMRDGEAHRTKRPLGDLLVPLIGRERNYAVGFNYKDHAAEVDMDDPPFVFPKFIQPTSSQARVSCEGIQLMDYEAEVAYVLLEALDEEDGPPEYMGMVLANDLTDRWPIVKVHLDDLLGDESDRYPQGTRGYPEGKNREGFLPLGPFLVIPRDYKEFIPKVEFRLFLNGQMRQSSALKKSIWGPDRIIDEVFRRKDWNFRFPHGEYPLLGTQMPALPSGTLLVSGTPEGILLKRTNWWNPWLFLSGGDEIIIQSNYLGSMQTTVED